MGPNYFPRLSKLVLIVSEDQILRICHFSFSNSGLSCFPSAQFLLVVKKSVSDTLAQYFDIFLKNEVKISKLKMAKALLEILRPVPSSWVCPTNLTLEKKLLTYSIPTIKVKLIRCYDFFFQYKCCYY